MCEETKPLLQLHGNAVLALEAWKISPFYFWNKWNLIIVNNRASSRCNLLAESQEDLKHTWAGEEILFHLQREIHVHINAIQFNTIFIVIPYMHLL